MTSLKIIEQKQINEYIVKEAHLADLYILPPLPLSQILCRSTLVNFLLRGLKRVLADFTYFAAEFYMSNPRKLEGHKWG